MLSQSVISKIKYYLENNIKTHVGDYRDCSIIHLYEKCAQLQWNLSKPTHVFEWCLGLLKWIYAFLRHALSDCVLQACSRETYNLLFFWILGGITRWSGMEKLSLSEPDIRTLYSTEHQAEELQSRDPCVCVCAFMCFLLLCPIWLVLCCINITCHQ